jgi:hypothetical protein
MNDSYVVAVIQGCKEVSCAAWIFCVTAGSQNCPGCPRGHKRILLNFAPEIDMQPANAVKSAPGEERKKE